MDKSIVLTQVLTLFLMMAAGFYARKRNILNPDMNKGLIELLLNITAPCMTIASFSFVFSRDKLVGAGIIVVFTVAFHVLALFVTKLLYFKVPGETNKVMRFATVFTNCGFMGYPVAASFYGNLGVFYTAIYAAVFTFFIWTLGVALFTGKTDIHSLRKVFINPGVIAISIGMIIFLFSLKLPVAVGQAIQIVGSMTTPVSMIVIGAMLADIKPLDLFSGRLIYYGAMLRLMVIPIVTLAVLKLFGLSGVLLGVCVLAVAMPAASISVAFAERNNGDAFLASRFVFLTTIMSVVTIPLVVLLI